MFFITLKTGRRGAAIEKRLFAQMPTMAEIAENYGNDPTSWAVAEMTDEEFDAISEIEWLQD